MKTVEQELFELELPQLHQLYYEVNSEVKELIKKVMRIKKEDKWTK